MIRTQPLIAATLLVVFARVVAHTHNAHRARRRAVLGVMTAMLGLMIAGLVFRIIAPAHAIDVAGVRLEVVSHGWIVTTPFVDFLVALMAVGLAPVVSHRPRTLAAILDVIAVAIAFLAFTHAVPMTLLWCASIVLVGKELRKLAGEPSTAQRELGIGPAGLRAFTRYHSLSLGLAVTGTSAMLSGFATLGAAAWLMAIAVREAIVPTHGWLPGLFATAPLGLVVALIAPQLGVYAQLAVLGSITGGDLAHGFAVVGAFTAICGAAIGLVQGDARRAAAWLVISQTGLIAFGLENASLVGRTGAVMAWQVMALSTSGFVMTLAALEARRGSLSLHKSGGSFARTPRMAVAFLFLGFASVALPLTSGFIAEDLLVQGSVDEHPQVGFAVIVATALNGVNVMRCFSVLFSGTSRHQGEQDLTRLEAAALTATMAVLLLGGLVPRLFVTGPAKPAAVQSDH